MPLPLIPLIIGAVGGGATVWTASSATQKITSAVLVAGVAYMLFKKGK